MVEALLLLRLGKLMFVVIVETQVDVEEQVGRPAYLARFQRSSDLSVGYEYGIEVLRHENRRALAMLAKRSEVFIAQRWWRVGGQEGGGEVVFTIDDNGSVIPLSRDEADVLLGTDGTKLNGALGARQAPANIFCRPSSLSGTSIVRGWL
ncbi:hypothetical protein ACVWYH_005323 [Bradyrhizobium sp. GM24.11]